MTPHVRGEYDSSYHEHLLPASSHSMLRIISFDSTLSSSSSSSSPPRRRTCPSEMEDSPKVVRYHPLRQRKTAAAVAAISDVDEEDPARPREHKTEEEEEHPVADDGTGICGRLSEIRVAYGLASARAAKTFRQPVAARRRRQRSDCHHVHFSSEVENIGLCLEEEKDAEQERKGAAAAFAKDKKCEGTCSNEMAHGDDDSDMWSTCGSETSLSTHDSGANDSAKHGCFLAALSARMMPCRRSALKSSARSRLGSVSFAQVQVREYSQVLGDHPCCSDGPPIALGWEFRSSDAVQLEDYEKNKRSPHVRRTEMKLDRDRRREILCGSGCENTTATNASNSAGSPCKYSAVELRRAERRLQRDKLTVNRKKCLNSFFAPCPAMESACRLKPPPKEVGEERSSSFW